MQQNNLDKSNNQKVRYFLAPAIFRFLARLIDYIVVFLIIFVIALLVFMVGENSVNWTNIDSFKNVQAWKYLVFAAGSFVIIAFYFIGVPCWTKGRTIGCWIFKLMIVNMHITRKFWISMIRREILLSGLFGIISLILGITLASLGDDKAFDLLKCMLVPGYSVKDLDSVATLFDALFYVSGIILFLFILWMFIKNKKRCLQDVISDTVTIRLNSKFDDPNSSQNKKNKPSTKNYRLPADVESIDLGEIDQF